METLTWIKLAREVVSDTSKVPYESNKHLFTKIAFDVFQLNTSPVDSLWILENGDDGKQYLVAKYSDEEPAKELEAKSSWVALADTDSKNVTLLYKDKPIQRFASSDFGFTKDDVHIFQKTLVQKLSSDKSFVTKLIKSQPQETQEMLTMQFPELA